MNKYEKAVKELLREEKLLPGDRLPCNTWTNLKRFAFYLTVEGYEVGVMGFKDMLDNVLTITALRKEEYDA